MNLINNVKELNDFIYATRSLYLYGAGFYLDMFLSEMNNYDKNICERVKEIIVTNKDTNFNRVRGIKVVPLKDIQLSADDTVILTLGERYVQEVYELLKDSGVNIVQLDFNMFQRGAYEAVRQDIQPFIDAFSDAVSDLNIPEENHARYAWTCWWQGEENAPELIQCCFESQRRMLPSNVKHVILTKDNFTDYIDIPNYILDKMKNGSITLTTLSDIIRASVLYKYGGFWMDATLWLSEPLSDNILNYPLYTRSLAGTQFCTNTMWSNWFWYVQKGDRLFHFLMEAFFYYYTKNDSIKYYLTVDYIIAIACNTFSEVEAKLKAVPYNNENALELGKHLLEQFSLDKWEMYIGKAQIHKLSYKLDQSKTQINDTNLRRIIEGTYQHKTGKTM